MAQNSTDSTNLHHPPGQRSIGERFVLAFGGQDWAAFADLYDEDVVLYAPFAWQVRGRDTIVKVAASFHTTYPGLRMSLQDEFASADGERVVFRYAWDWHNTGPFRDHAATGKRGTTIETHTLRLHGGRIREQVAAHNTAGSMALHIADWGVEFPRVTPDPALPIVSSPA